MYKLLRIKQIIGDPKATPPIEPIIPVCRATVYRRISDGTWPKPVRLGPRTVAFREQDIRAIANGEWVPENA
ncbi:phage regulatory protein, AlpA family [Syntrophotalea carbinolica DSM 2380]|uniref:Phage regulatory protein, AlpA family n=1 Tax=Syntrophotalea carbinolica (strain DSM 2380 / NBRC 103641 / GraBd1) TaxID=338963 RepID=Q0C6J1_SYNC1|nr:phage regulatory protein, AlpA family [Syntrophotalea carbinolica DSM 2380]